MTPMMAPLAMLQQAARPSSLLDRMTAGNLLTAAALLFFIWLLIRLIEKLLDVLSGRASRARFFFKRLGPVIRITLWLVAALAIVDIFSGDDQTAFFAGVASMGIALGLPALPARRPRQDRRRLRRDRPHRAAQHQADDAR
jgi:hypothetical protein